MMPSDVIVIGGGLVGTAVAYGLALVGHYRIRPPIKPITLEELAGL